MFRTIEERILAYTDRRGQFNRRIAKRAFRVYDNEYIHNSVMRVARELAERGILRRNGRGNYTN